MSDPSNPTSEPKKGLAAITPEQRLANLEAGRAAKAAFFADQEARTLQLGDYTLTPDFSKQRSGVGAGWKLSRPKQPDRWFANPDAAKVWLAIQ